MTTMQVDDEQPGATLPGAADWPKCGVCTEVIHQPTKVNPNCPHVFCTHCVHQMIQTSMTLNDTYDRARDAWTAPRCLLRPVACPLCRAETAAANVKFLAPAAHEWDYEKHEPNTDCQFCAETIETYPGLIAHLNQCSKRYVRCPACKQPVDHADCKVPAESVLQKHLNSSCPRVLHQCGSCWRRGSQALVDECGEIHGSIFSVKMALQTTLQRMQRLHQITEPQRMSAAAAMAQTALTNCLWALTQAEGHFGVRVPPPDANFGDGIVDVDE